MDTMVSPHQLSRLNVLRGVSLQYSTNFTVAERWAVRLIERVRPSSLRAFDQIPMRQNHLLQQVKFMAPRLAGKSVAFMGDHDSASLLLGLLGVLGRSSLPKNMLLLDFDERLLVTAQKVAKKFQFDHILECRLYNVFDPIPEDLVGVFDWFYTNPPYGCRNEGESARLFVTRCCRLAKNNNSRGCIILPDDDEREWTRVAMLATQRFLCQHNWAVDEKISQFHKYHLDDDRELTSSLLLVKCGLEANNLSELMPYARRAVHYDEIEHFYGESVRAPYPHYIRHDGSYDFDWYNPS